MNELTMTPAQWIGALADAWDRGFRSGESFANFGSDNTTNPYRTQLATLPAPTRADVDQQDDHGATGGRYGGL